MPRTSPLEKAQALARTAGLFFLPRGAGWDLYRRMPDRRVWIGRSSTEKALHELVRRCARTI